MTLTLSYDAPVDDYNVIPAGTVVEVDTTWNAYIGFTANKWNDNSYYFNNHYFVELSKLNDNTSEELAS